MNLDCLGVRVSEGNALWMLYTVLQQFTNELLCLIKTKPDLKTIPETIPDTRPVNQI